MTKLPQPPSGSNGIKIAILIVACVISAGVGGAMSRHLGASTYEISYSDFISVMLTAVSLLMTILAIFLAVFGVLGWSSIERRVHEKAEIYLAKLDPVIQEKVEDAIRVKTNEIMYEGIASVEAEVMDDVGDAAQGPEVK